MLIYADKVFENPIEVVEAFCPNQVKAALDKIEFLKNKGHYLVGYMRYDLKNIADNLPLVYFEAFDSYKPFEHKVPDGKIGTIVTPLISKDEYVEKVAYIKEQIRKGVTYEVNYTYPSSLKTNASEIDLYNYLLQNQRTPYNAFLQNKYETILSFSPELFFTLSGNKIRTKPMKGTVRRGNDSKEDAKLKDFLFNDLKNRTENIMIVELISRCTLNDSKNRRRS